MPPCKAYVWISHTKMFFFLHFYNFIRSRFSYRNRQIHNNEVMLHCLNSKKTIYLKICMYMYLSLYIKQSIRNNHISIKIFKKFDHLNLNMNSKSLSINKNSPKFIFSFNFIKKFKQKQIYHLLKLTWTSRGKEYFKIF